MPDTSDVAEANEQHIELLPARTVMSLFSANGDPGTPGSGGQGEPGNGYNEGNVSTGNQVESDSAGFHGRDGSANPGR